MFNLGRFHKYKQMLVNQYNVLLRLENGAHIFKNQINKFKLFHFIVASILLTQLYEIDRKFLTIEKNDITFNLIDELFKC